jgi:tRNA G37 N-methylase Trm5
VEKNIDAQAAQESRFRENKPDKDALISKYVAFADAFSAEEEEKTGQFPDNKKIKKIIKQELMKNKETLGKTKTQILPDAVMREINKKRRHKRSLGEKTRR